MFGLREIFRCRRPNRQLMAATHNRYPAVTKKRDSPQFWRSAGINHAGFQIDITFSVTPGACTATKARRRGPKVSAKPSLLRRVNWR